jgi:phage terminase large subunit-like protein
VVSATTKRFIRNKTDAKAVKAGYVIDRKKADHVIDFFAELRHTLGQWAGKPIELMPWQRDELITPLFGWVHKDTGLRRFRTAYIEVPKKNGKSTLCSGLALYLLAADGEPGSQVYCAAASRDQATIVYREASRMAKTSPLLKDYILARDSLKHLALPSSNSFLKALSAEHHRQEGLNWHGLIFDELHAQPDRRLWDCLRYGGASRREPLLISITTAGFDRHSICYEQRTHAERVLNGTSEDLTFFGLIRCADEDDDWTKFKTWKKANPSLDVTINRADIRASCIEAKESPTKENSFKRYRLNIWTEQDERWMPMKRWDSCAGQLEPADLEGQQCFCGLDLASTRDIAALSMVFPTDEGVSVLSRFWIPKANALERERRDRVPYLTWAKEGLVTLTAGDVIDYDVIRQDINDLNEKYNIKEIAIDRWNAAQITTQLQGDGFEVVMFGQGFASMSAPTKELEKIVYSKELTHGGCPVLRWMAGHVVVEQDAAGNLKLSKRKSQEKIDGLVALVMALGRANVRTEPVRSVYSSGGLSFV